MAGTREEEQLPPADIAGSLAQLSENLASGSPTGSPAGQPPAAESRAAEPPGEDAGLRPPNLAAVRECQPPTGDGPFVLLDPRCSTEYHEQFRLLRTQLLLHRARFDPDCDFRVVGVMSTQKGEGKSFTASNLATVLAVAGGQRVLLIDSDPESKPVPIGIPLSEDAGLPQALSAPADWVQTIHRVKGTPLYIMARAASKLPRKLDLEPLPQLLTVLRQHFQWIIVDGAAFASCPDAPWLAAVSDGTLLVVRKNVSSFGAVQDSLAGIPAERLVGVVFNQSKKKPKATIRLRIKVGRNRDTRL